MKRWVVKVTITDVYHVIVENETKDGASNLDDGFIAGLEWNDSCFSEVEVEVLGEEGQI